MKNKPNLPAGYSNWKSVYYDLKSQELLSKQEIFIGGVYFTIQEIEQALIDELLDNQIEFDSAQLILLAIDESHSIAADTKASLKTVIGQLIKDYSTQ